MSKRPRRNHTPAFKAKVALAVVRGEKTLSELARQFDVPPNQITTWKAQLLEEAAGMFGSDPEPDPTAPAVDVKTLHAKIGELTLTSDFVRRAGQGRPSEGRAMIDRGPGLSITKPAKVLGVSRGSVYSLPRLVSPADLAIMRRTDERHLDFPLAGSRMLRDLLNQEGDRDRSPACGDADEAAYPNRVPRRGRLTRYDPTYRTTDWCSDKPSHLMRPPQKT